MIFCKSKRQIDIATASEIVKAVKQLTSKSKFVGVFSNESIQTMNMTCKLVGLDLIQLHGNEKSIIAPLLCRPSIKVYHVMDQTNFIDSISIYNWSYILLDTGVKDVIQQGGSGVTFV